MSTQAMSNGSGIHSSVNVKELKNKFNGPPVSTQPAPPKPASKSVPKSPSSAKSPTLKKEFALGKSNIYIEDKTASGYKFAGAVTAAKPGSKVSELAKNYPHPHPVQPQRQSSVNQQTYMRTASTNSVVAAAPPVRYAENATIRSPSTPVTVSPWESRENPFEIKESVKTKAARLNSRDDSLPLREPATPPSKLSADRWSHGSTETKPDKVVTNGSRPTSFENQDQLDASEQNGVPEAQHQEYNNGSDYAPAAVEEDAPSDNYRTSYNDQYEDDEDQATDNPSTNYEEEEQEEEEEEEGPTNDEENYDTELKNPGHEDAISPDTDQNAQEEGSSINSEDEEEESPSQPYGTDSYDQEERRNSSPSPEDHSAELEDQSLQDNEEDSNSIRDE